MAIISPFLSTHHRSSVDANQSNKPAFSEMNSLYVTISEMVEKQKFIPIADLETVWAGGLEQFVKSVLQLQEGQIDFAREHWLKTISLLVYVLGGTNWDRGMVDWIRDRIDGKDDWDANLHIVDCDQLTCLTQRHRSLFVAFRPNFTAAVLKEGKDYTLGPQQLLPFIGESEELGHGMSGAVTGHQVAPGHLILIREVCPRVHSRGFA
jgi:hypothetical protein